MDGLDMVDVNMIRAVAAGTLEEGLEDIKQLLGNRQSLLTKIMIKPLCGFIITMSTRIGLPMLDEKVPTKSFFDLVGTFSSRIGSSLEMFMA
jgi:hypothetical protein